MGKRGDVGKCPRKLAGLEIGSVCSSNSSERRRVSGEGWKDGGW